MRIKKMFSELKGRTDTSLGDKFTLENGKKRFCKTSDNVYFEYGKGSKYYGWNRYLDKGEDFEVEVEDEKANWEHRVKRVIKALEKSGLWENLLTSYKNLLTLGYDNKKKLYDIYEDIHYNKKIEWEKREETFTKEIATYIEKYPFLLHGNGLFNTFYIWEMSDCILKSMYFGWQNKRIKEEIKQALKDNKKYDCVARASYDVSFNYDNEKKCAWYSEEYKNCGNGHYYLALDENLALFCEND